MRAIIQIPMAHSTCPIIYTIKYKPNTIDALFINDSIKAVINNLIAANNANVVFVGDGGSGKTSVLNAIVCKYFEGYPKKEYMDNVLTVNTLTDHGINYYRTNVKTFCQTSSTIRNKKKIVVLDDIDFITEQSQYIIRSHIERYCKQVQFIISCTNLQKVIDGIQSRFMVCELSKPTREQLMQVLINVKTIEHIDTTCDVDEFVVNISNQNIHNVLNYMEKFKLYGGQITHDLAMQMCTNIGFDIFEQYYAVLEDDNLHGAICILNSLFEKGYSIMDIVDSMFTFVKNTKRLSDNVKYSIIPVLCKYIVLFHNLREDSIELATFTNNIHKAIKSTP